MVYVALVISVVAFVVNVVAVYKMTHSSTRKYLKRIQKMGRAYLETRNKYEGE